MEASALSGRADESSLVTAAALRDWPLPAPGGSKNTRGRVLVAGGSPSTPGAVMLAGLSALRVGAGVLALAVAESRAAAVAAAVPEAAVVGLAALDGANGGDRDRQALADAVGDSDAVLLGPGLDDPDVTGQLMQQVVDAAEASTTLVFDAFALGGLPESQAATRIAGRSVLTPNAAEAAHLLGSDGSTDGGPDVARAIAAKYRAVVSYQGHVAMPEGRCWTIPTGHAGLGTSGSGDVLAGAVAGLLARGADCAQAACWGTFLHATAGDRLAARMGRLGFLARELTDELPLVIVSTEA
jgi:ADP-dependent NAD(P)H-hydrate dehydratase